jgi:hypothetical protein
VKVGSSGLASLAAYSYSTIIDSFSHSNILAFKHSHIHAFPLNLLRPAILVAKVTKATTVTELSGIRMAAMIGDKSPCTANDNPMML